MFKFPIKYYDDNIIFTEDGCYGAFEIKGVDYENKSRDSKIRVLDNLTNFLVDITTEAKILIIPTKQEVDKIIRKNYKVMNKEDPLAELAEVYSEGVIDYLKEKEITKKAKDENGNEIEYSEKSIDYRTIILVKFEDLSENDMLKKLGQCFEYLLDSPKKALDYFLGVRDNNILQSKIEAFKKRSGAFIRQNELRVNLKALKNKDLEWLYRRINKRGLEKEAVKTGFIPLANCNLREETNDIEIDPLTLDIKCLFEGKISNIDRALKISTEDGDSYQSFLTLTEMPDLRFPGSEYIFTTQEFNFPIETCITIKSLSNLESKHFVNRSKKKVESEINNANEVNLNASDDTYIALDEVRDMEIEVNSRKKLAKTTISFCISADNKDTLENNVSDVMTFYKDSNFGIQRSVADQLKLYMEFIPGASRYTEDFVRIMSYKTIAGTGIGVRRELGDEEGFYLGETAIVSRKVFLNMARACLENKSASATLYGNLGTGKSFAANLIVLLHVIFGGYALIFDPKSERNNWIRHLPWLEGLISIVRLTAEEKYIGMLDPFNIYRDSIEEAIELAVNIVIELNKLVPKDDEYIVLKEASVKIKESELKSMTRLIEILEEYKEEDELSPAARRLARKLRANKEVGMSKLIFGTGKEETIKFDNRINILQIDNLKIPGLNTKKEDYTDEENLSNVLLMIMAQFGKKFALTPRNNFKIVLFDESWVLKNSVEGIKLYDFLTRMGRSLFTGCIFNGHSVLDIPSEQIKNTISYKFCFRTDEIEEAKRMCEYLKIDVSEENINMILKLDNGECLFKDLDGRVGKFKFDPVFGDITEAFNTTPKEDKKDENEEIENKDEVYEES